MKKTRRLFIKWVVALVCLGLFWLSLPEIPKPGVEFDLKEFGKNFWVQLYLAYLPSPMPGYPKLIVKDTVWKKGKTYRVKSNTYVAHGVKLTIEPGATVLMDPGKKITCMGHMVAEGRADAPIIFSCRDEGKHYEAVECGYGAMDTSSAPVHIFKYCEFKGGGSLTIKDSRAEVMYNTFHDNAASPVRFEYSAGIISHNKIVNNSTELEDASGNGSGIMVYTDRKVLVEKNEVYNNRSIGGRDGGGGIYAFGYDHGIVTIKDNIVRDNYSDRHGGGIVAYSCVVENNTIIHNRSEMYGGGIFSIHSRVINNRIVNNSGGKGGGIYGEYSLISHNLFDENSAPSASGAGLYFLGDGQIENNAFVRNHNPEGGQSEAIMISGGPVLSQNNIVSEKGGVALRVGSHSLSPDVDARENFWGITDPETIEALVYDWCDDSDVGMVTWDDYKDGWLTATPAMPEGVTIDIEKIREKKDPLVLKGAVNEDVTVGDAAGSPYRVTGNVLIRKGYTLTILPGTTLEFAPNTYLRVRGKLMAQGTEKKPIVFTGDSQSIWGALLVESRSVLNDMYNDSLEMVVPEPKCSLTYCTFENGRGIQMDGAGGRVAHCTIKNNMNSAITIRDAAADIENNRITNNHGGQNGGGIYAYSSLPVTIRDNIISGNSTRGDGGGIFAYGYHANAAVHIADNRITENVCEGQGGGVWASRSSVVQNLIQENRADGEGGGLYASFALVIDNQVDKNKGSEGGGIYAETNSTMEKNRITANHATKELGGGAYLNFWGMSVKNEIFRANRVIGNLADDTGGVYLNGSMVFEKNAIYKNQGFQLRNGNSAKEEEFIAPNCYWGVAARDEIDRGIHDHKDDPRLSRIVYEPFLTKDPT